MKTKKNILILLLTLSLGIVAQNRTGIVAYISKLTTNISRTSIKTKDFKIACNDLLSIYANKPKGLRFIKCAKIKDS